MGERLLCIREYAHITNSSSNRKKYVSRLLIFHAIREHFFEIALITGRSQVKVPSVVLPQKHHCLSGELDNPNRTCLGGILMDSTLG